MFALIDADLLVYRVGYTTNDADEGIARWRIDESIERILDTLETKQYRCYLSPTDKSNFRYNLFTDYKANRTQPKPVHYQFLRDHLIAEYAAHVATGQEADDALGIEQSSRADSVIVSIDKDLDQIPGMHYNFVKQELYKVSHSAALRSFYSQCLQGDATDNIQGIRGIGKGKASRMLEGCQDETEMLNAVARKYAQEEDWQERLLLSGNLLWIRKQENQPWTLQDSRVVSKELLLEFLNQ